VHGVVIAKRMVARWVPRLLNGHVLPIRNPSL